MPKASPISVLTCGLLLASAASADDAPNPVPTMTTSARAMELPDSIVDSRWSAAIDDIEFLDNSALARVRRLEDVTFLTISETPGTRLFLGVNRDGLIGLHFRMR